MKQLFLLSFFCYMCVVRLWAYDIAIDDIYYNLNDEDMEAIVTYGDNKYSGDVVIPDTIIVGGKRYIVTKIGAGAFRGCKDLNSVITPNSVIEIENSSFSNLNITSINLPNSIKTIRSFAFSGCSYLWDVDFPEGLECLENCSFQSAPFISVKLPESLKYIQGNPFAACSQLEQIEVSRKNPNFVSIDGVVFSKNMHEILICPCAKEGLYTIPSTVKKIGDGAFMNCSALYNVIIPNSVIEIGDNAFWDCHGIEKINIPNSVKKIGVSAFSACAKIESITIPNSVEEIGPWAFSDCSRLQNITIDEDNKYFSSIDGVIFNKDKSVILTFPCGKQGDYTIPSTVKIIDGYAFERCNMLYSVTIPSSVAEIEWNAFSRCENLRNVYNLNEKTLEFNENIFSHINLGFCTLYVPDTAVKELYLTTCPWNLFGTIKTISGTTIKIPDVLMTIHLEEAGSLSNFISEEDKYTIQRLEVSGPLNGDDIRFIREMAGWSFTSDKPSGGKLRYLNMKDATIVPGGGNFLKYDDDFLPFEYPNNLGSAGQWIGKDIFTKSNSMDYMFFGLSQLEELILPTTVEDVGRNFMYGCKNVRSITIPKNITDQMEVPHGMFSCFSLDSIFVSPDNPYFFSRDGALFYRKSGEYYTDKGEKYTESSIILTAVPCARTEFTIPEDVDVTDSYSFPEGCQLKELTILTKSPKLKPYYFFQLCLLENFIVSDDNNLYTTIDGVLYSKDLSTIVCYPSGRKDKTFDIPTCVKTIGSSCFNTSCFLESIDVPEGVNRLEESSFFQCGYLKEITLPSTLEYIGGSSFQHCNGLKYITCKSIVPPTVSDTISPVFLRDHYRKTVLYVPYESIEAYKTAHCWQDFETILPINTSEVELVKDNKLKCLTDGNRILVIGIDNISHVEFYSISGTFMGSVHVIDGKASFVTDESLVIVKIGDISIKVKK